MPYYCQLAEVKFVEPFIYLYRLSVYHTQSHAVIMNIDTVSYNTITLAFQLMLCCVIVLPEAKTALVLGPNKSLLEHLVFFNVAFECMF